MSTVGILGKKIGMTQIFDNEGRALPVTVIQAGPCPIVQVKTTETDGYNSIQIGFDELSKSKQNKLSKPLQNHFKKAEITPTRHLQEFRVDSVEGFEAGQNLDVSQFQEGDSVDCQGEPKGKGFMGTTKRYHFARGPMTHGSKSHRQPGSIGAGTTPSRVYKGQKMPGRRGYKLATVKNLKVAKIIPDQNILLLLGTAPGPNGSLVRVVPAVKVGRKG